MALISTNTVDIGGQVASLDLESCLRNEYSVVQFLKYILFSLVFLLVWEF
jgi:hypothetical protein